MIKNCTHSKTLKSFLKRQPSSKKGAWTMFLLLFGLVTQAQIGVTVTNRTNTTPNLAANYASLTLALNDLNAITAMSGPVTLTLTGSETAPVDGFTLGNNTLNTLLNATNTITLTGPATLNAALGVGTSTPASATPDGIFKLVGTDYVTLDGLTFTDSNTANPATMEFGLALFKNNTNGVDGCQYNTIKNCIFNMQSINTVGGSLTWQLGSQGIASVNAAAGAANVALTPTTSSGSNSYNKFYHNTINGGHTSIVLRGYADSASTTPLGTFPLSDHGNDIGGSTQANGNFFYNFGGQTGTVTLSGGLNTTNQQDLNVSYNTIDNTIDNTATGYPASGATHIATFNGINIGAATSASVTINNNNIKLTAAGNNTYTAINQTSGATAANNTIRINNNNIHDCSFAKLSNAAFNGIISNTTAAIVEINNNTFTNNSVGEAGTTSKPPFITAINTSGASLETQICTINNNTITNNTFLSPGASFKGIITGKQTVTCDGNTISGISCPNQSTTSTLAYTIIGISNTNTAATTASETYTNNTISDISIAGNSTTATYQIWGISNMKATGYTNNVTIKNNKIRNFSIPLTTCDTKGIVVQSALTADISNNKISDITATAATATTTVTGLFANNCTTANIYNNIIGNLTLPNATSANALTGMDLANATPAFITNLNLYYNTVYLKASSPNATNFGSTVATLNSGTNATLNNNILVNNGTAIGTGKSAVIVMSTASTTNYNTTSNNNLFNGSVVFTDASGTPVDYTFATFKTLVAPRDNASINVMPTFISTAAVTGTPSTDNVNFLHINAGTTTPISNAGTPIGIVTTDFDGDLRSTTTPDIGADEFTPLNLVVTNPAAVCSPATVDLTATSVTLGSDANLTYTYWTDSAATTTYGTPTQATAGTYYIKGTRSDNSYAIKSVTVTVNSLPQITITNPSACSPATTIDITAPTITAGSDTPLNYTYWTNSQATTAYTTPTAAANGTYYIKGTNSTTGCSTVKSVTVTINPLPQVTITNPTAVCSPATIDITTPSVTANSDSSLNYTYWTNSQATTAYTTPTTAANGTYYIKGTNSTTGCSTVKSVTVTVNSLPQVTITNPSACSPATTIDITANSVTAGSDSPLNYTYWTNSQATTAYTTPTTAANGTYYIKGTNTTTQCSTVKSVTVTINSLPQVTITNPTAVCSPATVDITAASVTAGSDTPLNYTYWTNSQANTAYTTPATAANGIYYIKGTNSTTGCSIVKPVTVTVNTRVNPTFSQVDPICYGATVSALPTTSNNTNGINGTWNPTIVSNTASDVYTFTPAANQCANTATMSITVYPMVPAPTGQNQQSFVGNKTVENIVVQKDTYGTITWYTSEENALAGTGALSTSETLVNGDYYAIQEINGCKSTTAFKVTVSITQLGVSQFDLTGLRYYPNPVKAELNISYNLEINSIELFNLLGQHLTTVRPNSLNAKVDMTDLPIGTYLLQVNSNGKSTMIKIAKN